MNKQELMNKIKEQCGDCEAWSGTDCTRNPYTQGCLKDEKKVELTDEEIAEEIVKALVNTKKSLEDLHEDDDDYDKLSLLKKINNSSLWLIQRLQDENERLKIQVVQGLRDMKLEVGIRDKEIERLEEENGKLKTLVSHFEQLEKQLSAEIERLKNFIDFKTANVMCDKCKEQTVKDVAKEILDKVEETWIDCHTSYVQSLTIKKWIKEHYGVEVE